LQIKNGEIVISPNTIYWVQMPVIISDDDKIELLKRDILLINCDYGIDDLSKLKQADSKIAAFFINLDGLILKNRVKPEHIITFCDKIAAFVESFQPAKTVIHTYTIDSNICNIFRSKGLIYIEKNIGDKSSVVSTITHLIKPIFSDENRIQRAYLRVNMYPEVKFKVEISDVTQRTPAQICFLKDLSLNGVGLLFSDKSDIAYIGLKDVLSIKIFADRSILTIPQAVVTRKDEEKIEIGVNYNLNDRQMIKEDTANYLVKHVYNWLKDVVKNYGKLE